jgi:hypothetical protein
MSAKALDHVDQRIMREKMSLQEVDQAADRVDRF